MSVSEKPNAEQAQKPGPQGRKAGGAGISLAGGVESGTGLEGRRAALVVNRTGGQGKTLLAQLLAALLEEQGRTVLSVDKAGGADKRSKLGRVIQSAVELGSGPELSQAIDDQEGFISHWDKFGEHLMAADTIIDVGANVIDSVVSWARISDARTAMAGGVACDLVIPIVASPQSVSDAVAILKSFASGEVLPLRTVTIVQNMWQGTFDVLTSNPDFQALLGFVNANPNMASMVVLPKATGGWIRRAEEDSISFSRMSLWSVAEMSGAFDFNAFQATREMKFFRDFLVQAKQSLSMSGAVSSLSAAKERGAPR